MTEKGLISDLEEAVNSQIIKPFVEVNFPPEQQRPAEIELDPLSFERKITIKEIFVEMMRNLDTFVQMGVAPNLFPSVEKMAQILEIPIETWKDATGMEQEEFKEMIKESKSVVANASKEGDEEKVPTGKKGKVKTPKIKPRKKDVNQEANRRRSNPTSKRANRSRNPTSNTKENG